MDRGDHVVLATDKYRNLQIISIDHCGPMSDRQRIYTLGDKFGEFRLTEREMVLNGARPA